MALHLDRPPKYVRAAAVRAARQALLTRRGSRLRAPVRLTAGIAVHTAGIDLIGTEWLSRTRRVAWRFYLVDAGARSISIEIGVHDGHAHISHLAYGPTIHRLLLALGRLDTRAPVGARLRFVRVPELFLFGAWLHTTRSDEFHEWHHGEFLERELHPLTHQLIRMGKQRTRAHATPRRRRTKPTLSPAAPNARPNGR